MENDVYYSAYHKVEADDMQRFAEKVSETLCSDNSKVHWSVFSKKQFALSLKTNYRNYPVKFGEEDKKKQQLEQIRKEFIKNNPNVDDDLANVEIHKIYTEKQAENQFFDSMEQGFIEARDSVSKVNYTSTDMQLPRVRAGENFVAFYPKGVKVFGNEEIQRQVLDIMNSVSKNIKETNSVVISSENLENAEKFYTKESYPLNVKTMTAEVSDYLNRSIEYQGNGEISYEDLKEGLKDTKVNYFDPSAKSIDIMRTRSEVAWETTLNQAVYSLAVSNELTVGVNGLSVASHDGKFIMSDDGTIKKESGYLFEVAGYKEVLDFDRKLYNYNIRYTMDNVECNFPTIKTNLPPQRMEILLENLNDVMSEKTANIDFCNSPVSHQHWITEANNLFKKEHLQEYTKQEIKNNIIEEVQHSADWRKNNKFSIEKIAQDFNDLQEDYFNSSDKLEETYVSKTNVQWRKLLNRAVLEMAKDGDLTVITDFNQLSTQNGKLDLNSTDSIQKTCQKYWSIQSSRSVVTEKGDMMNEFVPVFSVNNISFVMPPFRSTMSVKKFQQLLLSVNKEVDEILGKEIVKANSLTKNFLLADRAQKHFRDYCIALNSEAVYETAKQKGYTIPVDYESFNQKLENKEPIIFNKEDVNRRYAGQFFVVKDYREFDNPKDNKRFEYQVSFVLDNLEIKLPPIKSTLPPKNFQSTIDSINIKISEELKNNPVKRQEMFNAPWKKRIEMTMGIAKEAKQTLEEQHRIDMEREVNIKESVKKVEKAVNHVKEVKRDRQREDGDMQRTLPGF